MFVTQAIAFVGDSFCAAYAKERLKQRSRTLYQNGTVDPTYTELVPAALGYELYPCGYGSKGWWFSRDRLLNEIRYAGQEPAVIVFCHSDSQRINNSWNEELINTAYQDPLARDYYKYIYDNRFNDWAMQQWFKEIATVWSGIKTIHFHCFTRTPAWSDLLPGVVYTTPLIHVSIGELSGTDKEIDQQMAGKETRNNHLSNTNNQILSKIILDTINDYRPGQYALDLEQFELVNPNSINYPHAGYGTK